MSTVTIPRADIPIGEQDASGRFIASRDLYRWMRDITARVGGVTSLGVGDALAEAEAAKRLAGMAMMLGPGIDGEDGMPGRTGDTGLPGPAGAPGSGDGSSTQGHFFLLGDMPEPEPAFPGVRGADGAAGSAGAAGADGNPGVMFTLDVPEPEFAIPGARGADGATGAAGGEGAQGLAGAALFMLAEPAEPEMAWPGAAGATGAAGAPGGGGAQNYACGSLSIATGQFARIGRHVILTSTQRISAAGNGTLLVG